MSPIAVIIHFLKASAGVLALVPGNQMFPIQAPQDAAAPYIVINVVGGSDPHMLTGAGRYGERRLSLEIIGLTGTQADAIGDLVLPALDSIVKATIPGAKDIDVSFADLDITGVSDSTNQSVRILHFRVRWRNT